jgi:hypothetical protein
MGLRKFSRKKNRKFKNLSKSKTQKKKYLRKSKTQKKKIKKTLKGGSDLHPPIPPRYDLWDGITHIELTEKKINEKDYIRFKTELLNNKSEEIKNIFNKFLDGYIIPEGGSEPDKYKKILSHFFNINPVSRETKTRTKKRPQRTYTIQIKNGLQKELFSYFNSIKYIYNNKIYAETSPDKKRFENQHIRDIHQQIFAPSDVIKININQLKWYPSVENNLDFAFKINTEDDFMKDLYCNRLNKSMGFPYDDDEREDWCKGQLNKHKALYNIYGNIDKLSKNLRITKEEIYLYYLNYIRGNVPIHNSNKDLKSGCKTLPADDDDCINEMELKLFSIYSEANPHNLKLYKILFYILLTEMNFIFSYNIVFKNKKIYPYNELTEEEKKEEKKGYNTKLNNVLSDLSVNFFAAVEHEYTLISIRNTKKEKTSITNILNYNKAEEEAKDGVPHGYSANVDDMEENLKDLNTKIIPLRKKLSETHMVEARILNDIGEVDYKYYYDLLTKIIELRKEINEKYDLILKPSDINKAELDGRRAYN